MVKTMKVLVLSVGGNNEALVHSIQTHKPELVIFYASHVTIKDIGQVVDEAQQSNLQYEMRTIIVDDPNDLAHCYTKILDVEKEIAKVNAAPEDVVVDYTGGTKTMSAALVLATVARGYRYSCTESSDGSIVSADQEYEVIRNIKNPWLVYAVEEKRKLSQAFNNYNYAFAYSIAEESGGLLDESQREFYKHLSVIIDGYWKWDLFNHKEALKLLHKGGRGVQSLFPYVKNDIPGLEEFFKSYLNNREWLTKTCEITNKFNDLSEEMAVDLLSNAERRAEQGKYNDAIARLYRVVEMIGQIAFEKCFGVKTSAVPPDIIRDTNLRKEFINKEMDKGDKELKLGLKATYRTLISVKNDVGMKYQTNFNEFRSIMKARNLSILAHGTNSLDKDTFDRFNEWLSNTFNIHARITMPKLFLS